MESKKKKIIGAGIGYTIGNYLIKGLAFLTIPIFARLLETSDYGIYNTYIAYESIVYIIIGLVLHSSFKNAKYKFLGNFNQYVSSCILLSAINAAAWLVLINVFYHCIGNYLGLERWIVNLLLLHSFGSALIQYYNAYVGLYYEYAKFLKLSFLNAGLNIIGSIVLILFVYENTKYYGRIIGTAIPVIAIGIYIVIHFFKKSKPRPHQLMWKFALTYSLPIIPHGISQVILVQFDRIMISNMVGAVESGIYSFAYNVYTIIQVTGNSLANVWEPWFFEKMHSGDVKAIREKGVVFGVYMLVFSTILCFIAPEVILILGANKYSESIYCVIPIVIGGYFSFLYVLPCEIEYYHEKTKYIAMATSMAAAVNIGLNYICIAKWGYVAAAYTTLVTYLIYFCFHYFMAKKIEGRYIYSNKHIFLLVAVALIICGIAVLLIDFVFLRWVLAMGTVLICILFTEKKYKLFSKVKRDLFES